MLQHPTIDRLHELGLEGMVKSLSDLTANPESKALDHMEWLGILLEHEMTLRQQKRFEARARTAKLRHLASVEDIDYRAARGLDRTLFLKLTGCDWIREHRHCLLTGPCGVGKSWLACALGFKACRENLSVLYHRVPRLFALLALGRGDGRYAKLIRQLGRVDLLILDDWGPEPLLPEQQRDLLEIVEDRYNAGSLIITSQLSCRSLKSRTRGQSHPGRRHPRSDRPQRISHRTERREPAQAETCRLTAIGPS